MCAADRTSALDIEEGYLCGKQAVQLAVQGTSGVMVSISRVSDSPYKIELGTALLSEVANGEKPMPDEFIDDENLYVTERCLEYLRPLIGGLPEYVRIEGIPY
jgi:6-phosphofructokinase 1